jgi:hypothetical protein
MAQGWKADAARGEFRYLPLTGVCDFAPAGLAENETLLGLPFQFTTLYGTLRSDNGAVFTLTRRMTPDGGPGRLNLQRSTPQDPHFALCPEGRGTSRALACRRAFADGSLHFRSNPSTSDMPFDISCGAHMVWREGNVVNLSGVGIGPGLQYFLPLGKDGLAYVSHYHLVEGEILGERVRGFICADDTYKPAPPPSSERKHSPNPLVEHGLGIAIFNWANHYPDGQSEIGLFAIGHRDFGVGLYANTSGETITTPLIDGEVHQTCENGAPDRIDFDLTDRRWTFERDQSGTMPGIASDALELDGIMRSPGGGTPDVWFCWGQSFPANGLKPRRL